MTINTDWITYKMQQTLSNPKLIPVYVKADFCDVARDGGTKKYQGWDGKNYFVDFRINTKTRGKVFDRYPGDEGARMLAVELIETDVPPD